MSGKKKGGNPPEEFKFNFSKEAVSGLQGILQDKVAGLIGQSSGYLESLPQKVQDRIAVLKKIQDKKTELDKEYKKELSALEKKYREKFEPLYDQRTAIVSGSVEPTEQEVAEAKAAQKAKEEAETKEGEKKEEKPAAEKKEGDKKEEDVKGVPEFWLTTLKHHDEFGEFITEQDEPALKFLKDIRSRRLDETNNSASFVLEFFFESNPFFENDVLTKTYHLIEKDVGPTMFDRVESTEIKWKAGKNLTIKKVTKNQGGKKGGKGKKGPVRTVTVEEPCESFFNFFNPDAFMGDEDMEEEEMEAVLEDDYEMGLTLKEEIIPNAVLWFTGEQASEYGGFGFDEYDEEDDEEDEEDDDAEYKSDEDPDFVPDPNAPAQQPQECKQQ